MALLGSRGCNFMPIKNRSKQACVIRDLNTCVRISKHVCLEISLQKNVVLEQMLTNFQDYCNHSLQLTLQ